MPAQTAYLIMGHGSEIPKSKIRNIVPPGCTLVVEVHSGEVSYSNDNKFINYHNKSIYLDPINNYKEVVKAISNTQRTLAIYKEGDEYPDFSYTLLSYWTSESSSRLNPNEESNIVFENLLMYDNLIDIPALFMERITIISGGLFSELGILKIIDELQLYIGDEIIDVLDKQMLVIIKNMFTKKYYNTNEIFYKKEFYFSDIQKKIELK